MGDKSQNNVRALREAQLMSKAELARKAGLSPLTIDRVESGKPCRMDTKRKLILALGLKLADRHKVFPEEGEQTPPRTKRQRTREGEGASEERGAASPPDGPKADRIAGEGGPSRGAGGDTSPDEGQGSGGGRGAKSA